jgi:hypothetical protein
MEVTISDTTFWKVWNTLRDMERFLMDLNIEAMTQEETENTEQLLEDVRWRMTNLTTQMQILKDREEQNYSERCLNREIKNS